MKTSSEAAASGSLQRYSLNGATMGTRYTALYYGAPGIDVAALGASLFRAVDEVDRQMSIWNPASDLCRLNAAPANTWVAIPGELAEVLEAGLLVGRQSSGAFDIGMGELVRAWGFGPPLPAPTVLPAALPAGHLLEVDCGRRRARKRGPIAIDLSGIAKGYGVDRLARCLDTHGIDNYLVGIDGEMRARGSKPGGQPWSVALEKPVYGLRKVAGVMELEDMSIATSGDYRHYVDVDGKRYAHTMHPARQLPVSNRLAAVTVLAATCMLADAWATALLVLGEQDGPALAIERGMNALFVLRDGERLQEVLILDGRLCAPS